MVESQAEGQVTPQRRTALVTGASQGIGRATALALAAAGHRVLLAARSREKLERVADEIAPGETAVCEMDVGSEVSVRSAFEKILATFGRVDILVNNAGIARDQLLLRMKRAEWDAVLETNLTAAYLCCQLALPGMIRQRWGRIINVSSVVAQTGNAGQANYIASKAGLVGLTRALAIEVASRQITVNVVAPGFIETGMTAGLSEQVKQRTLERIPMGRMGSDAEVAAVIRFLASDEASYVTGQVISVNGGMYLSG